MIKFTRGDTYAFKFQRLNENNEVITKKADKLFFTVKSDYNTNEIQIQKTLENGISFDEDGTYHIRIENEDTRDLKYGMYVYDIQVITNDYVATISKGELTLEKEVTFDYE